MAEERLDAPAHGPARSDALARACRATRAARMLANRDAAPGDISWDTLTAIPAWALGDPDDDDALCRLGALWHAGALAGCIDGRLLARARDLLGPALLDAVLQAPRPGAGASRLPPAPALEPGWRASGLAIARAALPDGVRAAVDALLPPSEADAAARRLSRATAAAWVEAARSLPHPDAETPR